MSIQILSALPKDGAAISRIMSDWIKETSWMPRVHTEPEYQNFGHWMIETCDVVVAWVNEHIVGFLAQQDCNIQALYVDEKSRGVGVGLSLLQHAKSSSDVLELWTFQANLEAQKFYNGHGFVEDLRTDGHGNDEKLPDIHFVWAKDST